MAPPSLKKQKIDPSDNPLLATQPGLTTHTSPHTACSVPAPSANPHAGRELPIRACFRPAFTAFNPHVDDLEVMLLDVHVRTLPRPAHPAVIHLFAVTAAGNSVLLRVHNFFHYFYVPLATPGVDPCDVKHALNHRLGHHAVRSVTVVKRRTLMNYVPGDPELSFYKIVVTNPCTMRNAAALFRSGSLFLQSRVGHMTFPLCTSFEANLDFTLRFMIDTHLVGCSWITLRAGTYRVATDDKTANVQLVVDADAADLVAHKPEGKWLATAPLRRLSFDIECAGRKGVFPEPEHDSVIQIANYVWDYGRDAPVAKVVFTLRSCAPIVGADVVSFDSEKQLLSAWSRFVRVVDPDILTGYNIVNFDLPYLLDRAQHLNVPDFPYLGRITNDKTTMHKTKMSSSAFGTHDSRSFSMPGRVVFDMLQLITREYKLRSYSLNSVSAEFLGQQKEGVHFSMITDLQNGDEQTRKRLAVYCLKDTMLPLRLMDKLQVLTNYIEMARVSGIPLSWVVSRGNMIKVVGMLYKKCFVANLLIPDNERRDGWYNVEFEGRSQYVGVESLEALSGYYADPIAVLDFAPLLPSVIMAHNLCYSTLIRPEHLNRMSPSQYSRSPSGSYFVKKDVKRGILSEILESVLAARNRVMDALAVEKDSFKRSVLDGRQLGLKLLADSVHGFTGSLYGKLQCIEIAESATAYGQLVLETVKKEIESLYRGSTVISCDTNCVMVKFGSGKSLEECMRLGEVAAGVVTGWFPKPVTLKFGRCYSPLLRISKTKYAGLTWTSADNSDGINSTVMDKVRRNNCRLVDKVISSALELLLKDKDVKRAVDMVKSTISDLQNNKIDMSMLAISKTLKDYEGNHPHVELARKLKKRDPGTAPSVGSRVPYIIIKGEMGKPLHKRAEDPLYALEHSRQIDVQYYLEVLRKPLEEIFRLVMREPVQSLFVGEHTKSVSEELPKRGSIWSVCTVKPRCLGCKTPINSGAICTHCEDRKAEIYHKHVDIVKDLERTHTSLWTECQRCVGEICREVQCHNGDCPIFYRRRKAQKDLDRATATLSRFDLDW